MSKANILSDNEQEYIKYTLIYPDINDDRTKAYFKWRSSLQHETLKENRNHDYLLQFNRLREIEVFITILCQGDRPRTIDELYEMKQCNIIDEFELEFYLKVWAQKTLEETDNDLHYQELKDYFSEEKLEDLDDPYVQEEIESLQYEYEENKKYERMYENIRNLEFNHLNQNDISTICLILYRELNKPAEKHMRLYIRALDKKMLVYLIIKFGIDLTNTNDQQKQIRLAF